MRVTRIERVLVAWKATVQPLTLYPHAGPKRGVAPLPGESQSPMLLVHHFGHESARREIRTLEGRNYASTVFKTGALDRSAILARDFRDRRRRPLGYPGYDEK